MAGHRFNPTMAKTRSKRRLFKSFPRLCRVSCFILLPLSALAARCLSLLLQSTLQSSSEIKPRPSSFFSNRIIALEVASLQALAGYETLNQNPFCTSWEINVDSWWSDHPDWEIALQNATHQCFQPVTDNSRVAFVNRLYKIQHSDSCQQPKEHHEAFYKKISGSGWGVDIAHVIDGLQYAIQNRVRVFILTPNNWQYTVGKPPQLQTPPCPSADLDCYLLPLTSCPPDKHMASWTLQQGHVSFQFPWRGFTQPVTNQWLLQYATRPQTWLRKRAFDIAQATGLLSAISACTAFHVRRSDVVRHGSFSRRYHRISEYVSAAQRQGLLIPGSTTNNILLLTDDGNAIAEATAAYPHYNWFYIQRARHKADQGGWEHHIPSNDPALEVAQLHASFLLLQHCDALVHSKSNLADYFYAVMKQAKPLVQRLDIDQGKHHDLVHSEKNALSVQFSHSDI